VITQKNLKILKFQKIMKKKNRKQNNNVYPTLSTLTQVLALTTYSRSLMIELFSLILSHHKKKPNLLSRNKMLMKLVIWIILPICTISPRSKRRKMSKLSSLRKDHQVHLLQVNSSRRTLQSLKSSGTSKINGS